MVMESDRGKFTKSFWYVRMQYPIYYMQGYYQNLGGCSTMKQNSSFNYHTLISYEKLNLGIEFDYIIIGMRHKNYS